MRSGAVDLPVSPEVAYDYLVDPANRAQWQSSLRAVEVDGAVVRPGDVAPERVRAGLEWVDVTWPGLRPVMELTVDERPRRWVEVGRWHAVDADLTLTFTATQQGCRVAAEFEIRLPGLLAPLGPALTWVALFPVLADLRRAGRILATG